MNRADLSLRPENLLAFKYANLSPSHDDLFTLDDLPIPVGSLKTTYALVDHNRLGPSYGDGTVVGVIDHHEDEGLYPNANPRDIVVPVGSATSLVARHFKDAWTQLDPSPPPELASLLLTGILIDTDGLKPKGKAEQIDRDSTEFLLPLSTFSPTFHGSQIVPDRPPITVADITEELSTQKHDVSHLGTRDLFRRDYKEFEFGTPQVRVGLSTVPMGLKPWLDKDPKLGKALDAWAEERNLDVAGLLLTYHTEKKNKKRRGIVLWVKEGEEKLAKKLAKGLEKDYKEELDLDPVKDAMGLAGKGRNVDVWDQRNTSSSRKVIAPAIKAIIEKP